MTLIQYCYLSASAETPIGAARLSEILEVSRRNNLGAGITGILVSLDDAFLQILEGPQAKVSACLSRIRQDPRHVGMYEIFNQPIEARAFPDWSMAYTAVGGQAVGQGTIDVAQLLQRLGPHRDALGRAYTILESFCRSRGRDGLQLSTG